MDEGTGDPTSGTAKGMRMQMEKHMEGHGEGHVEGHMEGHIEERPVSGGVNHNMLPDVTGPVQSGGKRGLIVSGGQTDPAQLKAEYERLRADGGVFIAADSGLEAIRGIQEEAGGTLDTGIRSYIPDIVVGDFDSVSPDTLRYFQRMDGVRWERHRPEKDESDTELAFTIAAEEGCQELLLMGATGTRLDHVISNIHLLKAGKSRGLDCTILDLHNRIRLTTEPVTFYKKDCPYPFISFIQLSEEVTHMWLTGFKYKLEDYHMVLGVECGHCVSNEITEERAELSFEKGTLLIIESCD